MCSHVLARHRPVETLLSSASGFRHPSPKPTAPSFAPKNQTSRRVATAATRVLLPILDTGQKTQVIQSNIPVNIFVYDTINVYKDFNGQAKTFERVDV